MEQNMNTTPINPEMLVELVRMRMPFGKYKGRILCDLLYMSGYRIAGGLLWSPRIPTGQRYLDGPHSLVKIIDGIELKA